MIEISGYLLSAESAIKTTLQIQIQIQLVEYIPYYY